MSPATRISTACTAIAGCPPVTVTLGTTATFEHTALGISAETVGGATTYYVRAPGGDLLAARTPAGTYYYLFDGEGSVIAMTNATGGLDATYSYDAYGQLTAMTSNGTTGINNPWRYVSAYQDGTGLYKMGVRYYDPALGRFTQQDPVYEPLDPKLWNRYTYVGGDPVNYGDPSGLCSMWKKDGKWHYSDDEPLMAVMRFFSLRMSDDTNGLWVWSLGSAGGLALDQATGKTVWKFSWASGRKGFFKAGGGAGTALGAVATMIDLFVPKTPCKRPSNMNPPDAAWRSP